MAKSIEAASKREELVDLYLRFRWLLEGLKDLPVGRLATIPDAEVLLTEIIRASQSGAPYPIRKLVAREEVGHFNTVRKRIQQLEAAGFVTLAADPADSRVKRVVPTEQALRYFAECGAALRRVQP